jgi:Cu/Ag efflux pump CusA
VQFTITAAISTADAIDDVTNAVEVQFWPQLDNQNLVLCVFRATATWATYQFSYQTNISAGTHTVRLARNVFSQAGRKAQANYYGTGGQSGITLTVTDMGVAK